MGATLFIQPEHAEPFEVGIGNTATIGRAPESTVCLSFSPRVSRQHAIIRCHNGFQYQLIDLGSRNGTYVNDQRVVVPVLLTNGARIRIADNTLTFAESLGDEPPASLETTVDGTMSSGGTGTHPVAMLVCDIRGFCAMSELIHSSEMAQILGTWFREIGNLVTGSGGVIDKFIGDAMLAYWCGHDGAEDCRTAFRTGRAMLALADARAWPCGTPFRLAVALHCGEVISSTFGPAGKRDATIIGDAVNTVCRLEGVAKELNQPLIISGDFHEHVSELGPFVDFGARTLKGKVQPVTVFAWEIQRPP